MLFTFEANPPVLDSVMQDLINRLSTIVDQAIPIAWVNGTWDEFDDRGLVYVSDYPRNPPKKATSAPADDGYVTPEERDVKTDDPRRVRRENKMVKYMEEHNERSTKLAKGAALDLKTQQSNTVTEAGLAKRLITPEPADEPKKRRSKTPIAEPKPGLRRSTRARKNTPKYT